MEVCPNCFNDKELSGFISSSVKIGTCGICRSHDVRLLDIVELLDFFQELVNNFQTSAGGTKLISIIRKDWKFFKSDQIAVEILNNVLPNLSTDIKFPEELVAYTDDINENLNYWDTLKDELKWQQRFLSDISYLEDLGWDGFFNTQFELTPKHELFRGRVHHQSGLNAYNEDEMMCPEPRMAKGGRANPSGIPYLYLCDNQDTVLYEIRASYLDELSIGTFRLKSKYVSTKIVDFTEETSLYQPARVNETIKASLLRERISRDLSKPMRRYDSEIEYIPTQFICEFIRIFTGASGIQFRSSLHPPGKNIVMFDQEYMECKQVLLKKVSRVNLEAVNSSHTL